MRKAKVGIGKVAFAVFSALLCADAHAAEHNWTLIKKKLYGKSRPMKVDFYVDAETVKRKGDTVWLDSMEDFKHPDGRIVSAVYHYEFKCQTNKYRSSDEIYDNISMARGAATDRSPVSEFREVNPEGHTRIVYEYACRRQ